MGVAVCGQEVDGGGGDAVLHGVQQGVGGQAEVAGEVEQEQFRLFGHIGGRVGGGVGFSGFFRLPLRVC